MKKNKNKGVKLEAPVAEVAEPIAPIVMEKAILKAKEEPSTEIESMAEMSSSDNHHWSHLEGKTDQAAESIVSGNFDNALATEMAQEKP